jgi:quinol-cytochrome oxidoreductase complex cytochrome b subunit
MTNDSVSRMCDVWQQGSGEPPRFNPDELRRKMNRFERTIARRNLGEYLAAALVIAVFLYYAWIFPTLTLRVGCGLIVLGTIYVMYQLHRRASARPAPADMGLRSCVDFQRTELERHRDALQSVWSWYLLPFVPGMCIFLFGLFQFAMRVTEAAGRPFHAGIAIAAFALVAGCVGIVFMAVWLLNRWAANKLQIQIDELNRLTHDSA